MSVTVTLLSLLCSSLAPCSDDRRQVATTGNRTVDLLIDDIRERRRSQAIAWISDVVGATGRPQIVRTPAQFVDRLIGCSPNLGSVKVAGLNNYYLQWNCGAQKYFSYIFAYQENSYVSVSLDDEITNKIPAVAPAPSLPGPDRHVPPSKDFIDTIAKSVIFGDPDAIRALMKSDTIVSLARRDNHKNVDVFELEELGPAAISSIRSEAFKRVGKPVSFECVQERYGGTCTLLFARPGVALTCWIGAYAGRINAIRFTWQTHEQDVRDRARHW